MEPDSAALFLDFGEIGAFVISGVRVVVPRDGIESGHFGGAACDDGICHADNGGGVHAATEVSEDGAVGTESPLDGFGKDGAEVFFVFGVGAVADFLLRIEIPILPYSVFSGPEENGRGRWDCIDANIRRQMCGREHRQPASDVLLVECEGFARKQNEWIKDGAPGDLVVFERIVEMARTDGIFGQDQ